MELLRTSMEIDNDAKEKQDDWVDRVRIQDNKGGRADALNTFEFPHRFAGQQTP
jgi:hypothetical protein